MEDEFRVEVELDDDEHGYSFRERLRAFALDGEARRRLTGSAVVTRDGSRLYVYTGAAEQAREAERVVRDLLEADRLTGTIAVTRWHDASQAWEDAAVPLPQSPEERRAEEERRVVAELREAELEGSLDWRVVAHLPSRDAAGELARRLEADGVPFTRRWRYVFAAALTDDLASELADSVRAAVPAGTEVWVEPNLDDVPLPVLLFLPA